MCCADFDSLIQEEVTQREMCDTGFGDEQKARGVLQRNRTTFTPEQSRALEQGDFRNL